MRGLGRAAEQLGVDLGFGGQPVLDFVSGRETAIHGAKVGCPGDQGRALLGVDKIRSGDFAAATRLRGARFLAGVFSGFFSRGIDGFLGVWMNTRQRRWRDYPSAICQLHAG